MLELDFRKAQALCIRDFAFYTDLENVSCNVERFGTKRILFASTIFLRESRNDQQEGIFIFCKVLTQQMYYFFSSMFRWCKLY